MRSTIALPAVVDPTPVSPPTETLDPSEAIPTVAAILVEIKVTPAPVSMANVKGPASLIQTDASKPRLLTTRNDIGAGSRGWAIDGLRVRSCAVRKRAVAVTGTALPIIRMKSNAKILFITTVRTDYRWRLRSL